MIYMIILCLLSSSFMLNNLLSLYYRFYNIYFYCLIVIVYIRFKNKKNITITFLCDSYKNFIFSKSLSLLPSPLNKPPIHHLSPFSFTIPFFLSFSFFLLSFFFIILYFFFYLNYLFYYFFFIINSIIY